MPHHVVTIGTFDGIHLGHQSVLASARRVATAQGVRCVAYTFDVPPRSLAGEHAPQLLLPPEVKRHLLGRWVDRVIEASFDEVRGLDPVKFVRDVLVDKLQAQAIVVGASFRFGRGRSGDVEALARLAAPLGLDLTVVPALSVGGEPVSSTAIRALLERGDVEGATLRLGRPPLLVGAVAPGDGIGRSLGFPTANLALDPRVLLPRHGVYVSRAFVDGARSLALTYVGARPTFQGSPLRCEAHWLSPPPFSLAGKSIEVHLLSFLRQDQAFASPDALRRQMELDLAAASRAAGAYPESSDPHPFGG